jgi:crossover junction endodeoxyribonuclease RuvC
LCKGRSVSEWATEMKILGLDPGSVITGYGVVEVGASRVSFVCGGRFRPRAREFPNRVMDIAQGLSDLLDRERPDVVVIEDVFTSRNVRASFKIAQVRGALLLVCAQAGARIVEYSPAEIKKAVVGNGSAAKEQVQFMVKNLLGLPEMPQADEADALAAALCHSQRPGLESRVGERANGRVGERMFK